MPVSADVLAVAVDAHPDTTPEPKVSKALLRAILLLLFIAKEINPLVGTLKSVCPDVDKKL
jgi:hypothetical protein